jgi:hypothetical protein
VAFFIIVVDRSVSRKQRNTCSYMWDIRIILDDGVDQFASLIANCCVGNLLFSLLDSFLFGSLVFTFTALLNSSLLVCWLLYHLVGERNLKLCSSRISLHGTAIGFPFMAHNVVVKLSCN